MDFLRITEDLRKQVRTLEDRIKVLEKENLALREDNGKFLQENNRLKERLGLNSSTSSLPPSRDLYRVKRHNRPRSGKRPGGQPGHQYHGYQPKTPDEVITILPESCQCGSTLERGGPQNSDSMLSYSS